MDTVYSKKALIGLCLLASATIARPATHIDRVIDQAKAELRNDLELRKSFKKETKVLFAAFASMLEKPVKGCIDEAEKVLNAYQETVVLPLKDDPRFADIYTELDKKMNDLREMLNFIRSYTGNEIAAVQRLSANLYSSYRHLAAQPIAHLLTEGNLQKLLENK